VAGMLRIGQCDQDIDVQQISLLSQSRLARRGGPFPW
jgi:hypothetical protein